MMMNNRKSPPLIKTKKGELIRKEPERNLWKRIYSAVTIWLFPSVLLVVESFNFLSDLSQFATAVSMMSFVSNLLAVATTIGLLTCLDIAPIYLAINLKNAKLGLESDRRINVILLLSIIISAFLVILIRWNLRYEIAGIDVTVSAFGSTTKNVVSVEDQITASTNAILGMLLPFATSLAMFAASYLSYNPLEDQLHKIEMEIADVTEETVRLEAMKTEVGNENSYRDSQVSILKEQYETGKARLEDKGKEYMSYSRSDMAVRSASSPSEVSGFMVIDQESLNRLHAAVYLKGKCISLERPVDSDVSEMPDYSSEEGVSA